MGGGGGDHIKEPYCKCDHSVIAGLKEHLVKSFDFYFICATFSSVYCVLGWVDFFKLFHILNKRNRDMCCIPHKNKI
jgi:hypothetical protein